MSAAGFQAVILAGGLGTRLRPLTYEIPKPMVPVLGKPFLEHLITLLKERGAGEILLLTGYLGEQIEAHFGDGAVLGIPIRYSREASPLGTGGALVQALPLLRETFVLLYGDSFLPIDFGAVHARLDDPRWKGVTVAYDNTHPTDVRENLALTGDGGVLLYLKDGDDPRLSHVEAGVTALRKGALAGLPEGAFSLEQTLFPRLIADGALGAYETLERFYDIGTPGRLETIRRRLSP